MVADGKAERKTVALGVETADAIQVTSGLKAGDVVVLDPPAALSSGAPVELQTGTKSQRLAPHVPDRESRSASPSSPP